MSNPSGPDHDADPTAEPPASEDASATELMAGEPAQAADESEPATEVFAPAGCPPQADTAGQPAERRFTAPSGFDAGSTEKIDAPPEPATEIFSVPGAAAGSATGPLITPRTAAPQSIPPRGDAPRPPGRRRSWGWVIALLLVIAALVAVAVLGTVLLTRDNKPKVSPADRVRTTIQNFDIAVQKGDLATLRSITCGATRDSYVNYDDRAWADTHTRVAAAKQYPVVASIDQVVVNGEHAEANVTTFMAYAPQTRSTRSFDLQFRDEQWKICQAPNS
jgi:hypothetical protein